LTRFGGRATIFQRPQKIDNGASIVIQAPVHVLLIEDDYDYAYLLAVLLKSVNPNGFILTHTAHLAQAVSALSSASFDLILIDLSLPDSDGLDTFIQIFEIASNLPIVVLTALDKEEYALRAVRSGAQDYLIKGDLDGQSLARAIQFAVERQRTLARLQQLSLVDELTGLLNRRGFLTVGDQHVKIARRSGRSLLLFFIDLDGLKAINDRYGHREGDQALRIVADGLRSAFRSSDVIARLGGDEFTVLAVDARAEAGPILHRLAETLVEQSSRGYPYTVSVSIGQAHLDPQAAADLEDLLRQADEDLYRHKRIKKETGELSGSNPPA
jgi:diguanylate cyclase (GGDEF)-like protein